jgi:predicted metalloprotease with PDZ domain
LQIFSTLNHKDKMIYIDMFKVIIQNNIYFFGDEDFKEFKEDFLLDLKNNYWSVEKKYLDILITTI